ncbi:MAG: response regulator transcription factor [Eubacterium sp.]|jgi:two-component system response regulator RegX3|nr:response regulator transcription factor [Eubacterium sp.]
MHYNCLIVDDETELAKMTAEYFMMFDVSTAYVSSAADCYAFLEENTVDLLLLDINLGDGSGFEVCRKVREEMSIPILFISARQSDDDVLVALSIGGDDYVKKPYSLSVLLAKVRVNLKRIEQMEKLKQDAVQSGNGSAGNSGTGNGGAGSGSGNGSDEADTAGRLALDAPTMSVIKDGERISLKAKEFALLKCLYDHKNTIVTKETLFDEVWGDTFYSDGTLNVHIRKLREKLEVDPNNPDIIKTIWGTGYILED